jgi:ribosomal protein L12E/L44/L45/RPP1/RPP2
LLALGTAAWERLGRVRQAAVPFQFPPRHFIKHKRKEKKAEGEEKEEEAAEEEEEERRQMR